MQLIERLETRTLFAVTPNDVLFPQEWWLQKVSVPDAWDFTTGSSKVVVNVNDSGIDYTHPYLYLNIWLNQKEIPFAIGNKGLRDTDADGLITFYDLNAKQGGKLINGAFVTDVNGTGYIDGGDLLNDARWENGIDNGGNGYVDDLIGWDFHDDDNDPMDVQNHGTMCAGVVGTVGNNVEGGAGVAWRVQLMATKRTDDKGATKPGGDHVVGLYYAADNGARVSSNSWAYFNPNKTTLKIFNDAFEYARTKDLLIVAAAGNNGTDNDLGGRYAYYPANSDLPNIISVAASTQDDQLASFSNWGLTTVDLAAPGEGVGSTIPVYQDPAFPYQGGFAGTSVAAPFVAGAAALLLARNPNLSYAQLKDAIISSVDPLPAFAGKTVSGGRLNVYRALAAAPAAAATLSVATAPVFSATLLSARRELLTQDTLLA